VARKPSRRAEEEDSYLGEPRETKELQSGRYESTLTMWAWSAILDIETSTKYRTEQITGRNPRSDLFRTNFVWCDYIELPTKYLN
jgi:hypothetical protein